MTAPAFRAVEHFTGTTADLTDLTELQAKIADRDTEIATLTDMLRDAQRSAAKLADTVFQYRAERDDYRSRYDTACDERDEALTRLQECGADL